MVEKIEENEVKKSIYLEVKKVKGRSKLELGRTKME